MPSTSAQIPRALHHTFSAFLADKQADPNSDGLTRLSLISHAVLALPEDPKELAAVWARDRDTLELRRKDNPGIKRAIQLTDKARQRLLDLYAACVRAEVPLQKQHIITLAIHCMLKAQES